MEVVVPPHKLDSVIAALRVRRQSFCIASWEAQCARLPSTCMCSFVFITVHSAAAQGWYSVDSLANALLEAA